jgi:hypothetical protein
MIHLQTSKLIFPRLQFSHFDSTVDYQYIYQPVFSFSNQSLHHENTDKPYKSPLNFKEINSKVNCLIDKL